MNRIKPANRFEKSLCRPFFTTAVVALMAGGILPSTAQDNEKPPGWFGGADDRTTMLAYGVPDSDYVMLHFSCTVGKPVVDVYVQDEESRAAEGDVLPVSLSAGGERIEFSEEAVLNAESGGRDVVGHLPLDDTLHHILSATETLEIVVDGHTQTYDMDGAAEPAAALLAACEAPKPAGDLDVTVTNKAKRPLHSLAYAEAGVASFDSDAFGYDPLAPGASRAFTIPGGRDICTFDLVVTFVEEDDGECCSEGERAGQQNLCENNVFIVHD